MGRPINKRKFSTPDDGPGRTDGKQFRIIADIGSGLEEVFIVAQRSKNKFLVASGASDATFIRLVDDPSKVTGPGFGYMKAGLTGSNSKLDSIRLTDGGTGYTDNDVLTLAGGTGTAATITVQATGGVIDSFVITSVGDYTVAPDNDFNDPSGGTGADAQFYAIFGSVDDEYAAKISNRNLIVNTPNSRRDTYTIDNENPSAKRNVIGD